MPNNRQWATILWLAALVMWALTRSDVRRSIRSVLGAACSPKILAPLVLMTGWVVGLVALASCVELWSAGRVTDTAFWFVTAGLVLFGNFGKVSTERGFVRRTALATLEIS